MDFASRISVTCFAASYAIGMVHEILRVFWPKRWIRWVATTAALAGLLAQTLFLGAITYRDGRLPIQTQFDSLITVSWLITLVYLYLLLRERRLGAGIFLLPLSLGLCLFAGTVAERGSRAEDSSQQVIAVAHGLLLLVGTVFVAIALATALMYLVKTRQLKRSGWWTALKLPNLERLDRLNTVAVSIAWPMMTVGIGLGFLLGELKYTDPKVISTMAAWVLFTALAHLRYQPSHRGRRIAVLSVVAGALVLFSVLGDPLFGTSHQSLGGAGP